MLLAERFSRVTRRTFFVAISAERIDCALMLGEGKRARWSEEKSVTVAIEADDGTQSQLHPLIAALQKLEAMPELTVADEMRIVVSDNWLAVAEVPWSSSAKHAASRDAYARGRLTAAGFEIEPADAIKLDDAAFGEPRLAVAYPAMLLTALTDFADRLQARFGSLLPLSVAVWELAQRRLGQRPQVVAALDDGLALLARSAAAGRSHISDVAVSAAAGIGEEAAQNLQAIWTRMTLRDPQLAKVQRIALLRLAPQDASNNALPAPFVPLAFTSEPAALATAAAPPSLRLAAYASTRHHALDALPRSTRRRPWRWVGLAAASALVGALGFQTAQTHLRVQSMAAQLKAGTPVVVVAPPPTAWNRDEAARVVAVNAAIRELNLPIAPILRALQPPDDIKVAVLSVETMDRNADAQSSSIKIVAQAKSSADMTRYVSFVADRKPFTGAYLTRHEIDETTAEHPYRFTVEAIWLD